MARVLAVLTCGLVLSLNVLGWCLLRYGWFHCPSRASCWHLWLKPEVPGPCASWFLASLPGPQAYARTLWPSAPWCALTRAGRNSGPREALYPGCSSTSKPWLTRWRNEGTSKVCGLSVRASPPSTPLSLGWRKGKSERTGSHSSGTGWGKHPGCTLSESPAHLPWQRSCPPPPVGGTLPAVISSACSYRSLDPIGSSSALFM